MSAVLPPKIPLPFILKRATNLDAAMRAAELTLVVAEKNAAKSLLKQFRCSPELVREYDRLAASGPVAALRLSTHDATRTILCIFVKDSSSTYSMLTEAARAWREAAPVRARHIALVALGLDQRDAWLAALAAAIMAGTAPLPQLKTKPDKKSLPTLTLVTEAPLTAFNTTVATQAGNHLARWLTTQPPNLLNAESYRKALISLANTQGWQHEFLDKKKLSRLKAGAFLAVARSNAHTQAGILRLRYRTTARKSRGTLCLVGKGICFDTGGINLKSHKSMFDMHTDMQGSAVAVGTLLALSMLKVPYDVDCWLALTENEIGPLAYRPQEVITAANGTTIQVVHSDAEGRMVLADTLALAARSKPALIIDFATLTGACVAALTDRMSGAFSNRTGLRDAIEQAGHDSGERVWCFPMQDDFDADLDSPVADIMQCTMDNKGDHILAARFLNRFVPETLPWIHIDLSSANRQGGLAHVPTEITGFGVRWAVQFMQQHSFKSSHS